MKAGGRSHSKWGAGQPPGLTALFLAQFWERLAFYGVLVLLVLYLVDPQAGLGIDLDLIPVLYGLFAAAVPLALLGGGWVADRWLGRRWSLTLGGGLITAGLLLAGWAGSAGLAAGLVLDIVGIGLFRPALLVTLGQLYEDEYSASLHARRMVGFTVLYLGINLGALGGYLAPALVGTWFGWSIGFTAAGLAMALGLLILAANSRHLPAWRAGAERAVGGVFLACLALAGLAAWLTRARPLSIAQVEGATWAVLSVAALLILLWGISLVRLQEMPTLAKRRTATLVLFALLLYNLGLVLTAEATLALEKLHIDRLLLGWEFPARWIAALDFVFLVLAAFAAFLVWRRHGRRAPGLITRLALGLLLIAAGWCLTPLGLRWAEQQAPGLGWLLAMSFLASFGDVLLVPAGLDAVSRLASRRHAGRLMAVPLALGAFGKLAQVAIKSAGEQAGSFAGVGITLAIIFAALLLLAWRQRLSLEFEP